MITGVTLLDSNFTKQQNNILVIKGQNNYLQNVFKSQKSIIHFRNYEKQNIDIIWINIVNQNH